MMKCLGAIILLVMLFYSFCFGYGVGDRVRHSQGVRTAQLLSLTLKGSVKRGAIFTGGSHSVCQMSRNFLSRQPSLYRTCYPG